jgi:hypothetical protein
MRERLPFIMDRQSRMCIIADEIFFGQARHCVSNLSSS